MSSGDKKAVLLKAAREAKLEGESQSEKLEEDVPQEENDPPKPRREKGQVATWVAQVMAAGKEWKPIPEEEARRRHRVFLTRIDHNVRCGTPPRLKRLSSHCHKCREVYPSDRDGNDTAKFCSICGETSLPTPARRTRCGEKRQWLVQ